MSPFGFGVDSVSRYAAWSAAAVPPAFWAAVPLHAAAPSVRAAIPAHRAGRHAARKVMGSSDVVVGEGVSGSARSGGGIHEATADVGSADLRLGDVLRGAGEGVTVE